MTAGGRFRFGCVTRMLAAIGLALTLIGGWGFHNAQADPIVRRMAVRLPGWPAGAGPISVALLSDIHIGSPATGGHRLRRIVAQVAALRPDLVVLAGDFVAGDDPARGERYARRLAQPLATMHAPLGVVAVLGNHDHWTAPSRIVEVLRSAGVTVLVNTAVERGPITLIGVDDGFSGHADVPMALAVAQRLPGARVVLTHTPDTAIGLPRAAGALLLAGHTHCGQAVLPWIGSLANLRPGARFYQRRYECGAVQDAERLVIVTGGIGGTLPLRYGAPPDLWLLTLGP